MCGRYSFVTSSEKIKKQFEVVVKDELRSSYNICPSQQAYVISDTEPNALAQYRWGLIPHWANEQRVGDNLTNARAEDIAGRPSFRIPIRHKRCVVLADSFYEWHNKQPHRIFLPEAVLMPFAGIWDEWKSPEGKLIRSFAIITTAANEDMALLHNRMPVILSGKEQVQKWLSRLSLEDTLSMLMPLANGKLQHYPVTSAINSARYDLPDAHREVPLAPKNLSLFD